MSNTKPEAKRYEPEASYIGTGEYVGDMRLASDGEYVLYTDYYALLTKVQELEAIRTADHEGRCILVEEIERLKSDLEAARLERDDLLKAQEIRVESLRKAQQELKEFKSMYAC